MVTTGFSRPYVAKYANTGSSVTYSGGMSLGRGVSLTIEPETADDNNFYADNVLAESETGMFTGGSATATVDGIANDAATLIFGLPEPTDLTVEAATTVEMQGYGAATNPPFCGFGCVRRTMMHGVTQYWPLVLPKVKFALPGDDVATQETQIDWQTQELEMTLFRDDTAAQNWKVISAEGLASEDAAYDAVVALLGGAGA